MTNRLILSLAFGFLTSCSGNKDHEMETAYTEMMRQHDVVMPQQGELFKLKGMINNMTEKMDSLKSIHPSLDTAKLHAEIKATSVEIDVAANNMSDWMHAYGADLQEDLKGKSHIEIMEELDRGTKEMKVISQQFSKSITDANHILDEIYAN